MWWLRSDHCKLANYFLNRLAILLLNSHMDVSSSTSLWVTNGHLLSVFSAPYFNASSKLLLPVHFAFTASFCILRVSSNFILFIRMDVYFICFLLLVGVFVVGNTNAICQSAFSPGCGRIVLEIISLFFICLQITHNSQFPSSAIPCRRSTLTLSCSACNLRKFLHSSSEKLTTPGR